MTYRLALVDKSKVLRLSKQGLGPSLISQRLGVSVARIMQIRKEMLNEEKGAFDSRKDSAEDGTREDQDGGSDRQVF